MASISVVPAGTRTLITTCFSGVAAATSTSISFSTAMNLLGASDEVIDHAIGHAREIAPERPQQQAANFKFQTEAHPAAAAQLIKLPAAAQMLECAALQIHDPLFVRPQPVDGRHVPGPAGRL